MEGAREGKGSSLVKQKQVYLSVKAVSDVLGVNPRVIFLLIEKGALPSLVSVGENRLFRKAEVESFLR